MTEATLSIEGETPEQLNTEEGAAPTITNDDEGGYQGFTGKEHSTTPDTPASGWRLLYAQSDGWYMKDSLGNITRINADAQITAGLFANRPTAGTEGRFFYATDTTTLYYDNGSSWDSVAGSDHGALDGLADDDHSQYHNDARGDARYALLANGVTNGDSHDHVGGDGAQIDHGGAAGLSDDDHSQYFNEARGDARYFTETEHLNVSAGAGDAGKPIKLDAAGHVDATMLNDGDIDHANIANTHNLTTDIDHDTIANFLADEHIDWTVDDAKDIHADNIPDLSATYAPAAEGVTNGDAHDHVGGDGGQIDHVNLANKGTNTHAEIDTHIAAGGGSGDAVVIEVTQAAHGFSNGDAVYNNAGTWTLARSDVVATLGTHIVGDIDTNTFNAYQAGKLTLTGHGLGSAGDWLFVSDDTAGLLTTTEGDPYSNPIAQVFDVNTIWVYSFRASSGGSGARVLDPSPDSDHTVDGDIVTLVAGESLVWGDFCYMKSDGKLWKADADGTASYPCTYFCTATIAADASGIFLRTGYIRDDTYAWTIGGIIYLHTTVGEATQTVPSSTGDRVQVLGIAMSADVIDFRPDLTLVERA